MLEGVEKICFHFRYLQRKTLLARINNSCNRWGFESFWIVKEDSFHCASHDMHHAMMWCPFMCSHYYGSNTSTIRWEKFLTQIPAAWVTWNLLLPTSPTAGNTNACVWFHKVISVICLWEMVGPHIEESHPAIFIKLTISFLCLEQKRIVSVCWSFFTWLEVTTEKLAHYTVSFQIIFGK